MLITSLQCYLTHDDIRTRVIAITNANHQRSFRQNIKSPRIFLNSLSGLASLTACAFYSQMTDDCVTTAIHMRAYQMQPNPVEKVRIRRRSLRTRTSSARLGQWQCIAIDCDRWVVHAATRRRRGMDVAACWCMNEAPGRHGQHCRSTEEYMRRIVAAVDARKSGVTGRRRTVHLTTSLLARLPDAVNRR